MPVRRVYSETLPHEQLVRPRTLALLARYGLEVVLAVRPWDVATLPDTARALCDAGVPLSVWPMLSDEEGRWANVYNAEAFAALTRSICDALAKSGALPKDVLFDLEPPLSHVRRLARVESSRARGPSDATRTRLRASALAYAAAATLARAVSEVHERGLTTSLAVWPLVALDPPGERAWQALLGTPVDALGAGHVSVMMYTSILEGWSRGAIRRRDAQGLLGAAAARAIRRWGPSAGLSLGCVGTGAFEDEPTYRDPSELAEDAAIARCAGCDNLSLFDLGGVLSREPAEAWLDAFVHAEEAPAGPQSKRVRVARTIARVATWALGLGDARARE